MQPEKKITKEDTWKADDLRKHIRGAGHEEDHGRRREEYERRRRGGESVERRQRDPEREARRERDKPRERDGTRERAHPRDGEKGRPPDRRTEATRDSTGERDEREKRREKDRVAVHSKHKGGDRENRDSRHDREEKENREKEREREKTREREKERTRERGEQRDRDKGREERDREKRREERDKERRAERERDRDEKQGEGGRDRERQNVRERKDGHRGREYPKEGERRKDESQDKRKDRERRERHADRERRERHTDKEGRERHADREPSGQKEDKEYREQRRKEKERRHKERTKLDPAEERRHSGESKEAARGDRRGAEGRLRGDRERAERDERGGGRRREGGDPEGDTAMTGSTKRSSSHRDHETETENEIVVRSESVWRSSQTQLSDTEDPVDKEDAQPEDQADDPEAQEYEEDFEDYEEDFEDVDDSDGKDKQTHDQEEGGEGEELSPRGREEVKAIQKAMEEENERVGSASAQTRLSTEEEEEERPRRRRDSEMSPIKTPRHGKFIDFVAAKHREVSKKAASKQKKRSTELLRLIDLDFSITFSLLDLPPVSEYDMFIKTFGTTNTKQAYVQCNEDSVDRDVQTEDADVSEKWTQHPAERNVVCGGPNLSQEDDFTSRTNIDSQRLARFLRSASQVVAVLLEEERAELQSHQKLRSQEDELPFSDGCLQLNTKLPFLHGRPVSLVHFSPVQRQTMLSVHGLSAEPGAARLHDATIICVWNIWEPSCPRKILVYESEVRSCCLSPGKATLVFAGTAVGSVALWDLREHGSIHDPLRIGDGEWTLRHPTFSTDAVLAASGHTSPVSSVEAVPASVAGGLSLELPLVASGEESSGLSFQLASLDENGILNLWVVVELPKANEAGSQTDLGLRPGGKVKLLHSSTLHTGERNSQRDPVQAGPTQTLLLKFLPSDSSQFFIGTNMSLVSHRTSHGLKAPPKFYRPQMVGVRPVDVTSISFSPFREDLFLVGCGDGSVRLHTVASEQPVMEWSGSTAGEPVVSVQWARTRPGVFCVLDNASTLHLWDLLEKDAEPVITEKTGADRVTAMAVFGDASKQNTFSGVALARQSGKMELQYFTKRFTVPVPADLEKLQSLVDEAF